MARYTTKLEEERLAAGWGRHCWIVDTHKQGLDALLRLMPEDAAKREVERLNKIQDANDRLTAAILK